MFLFPRTSNLIFVLVLGCSFAWSANIIPNGDFESASAGGWRLQVEKNGTGAGTLAIDASDSHSGQKAAHIQVTETSAENWHVQLQAPVVSTENGKVYTFRFWAKGAGSIHVGISGSTWAYLTGFSYTLTSEWTLYSGTLIGDGTQRRIGFYVALQKGTYSFDDVSLEATGELDPTWYSKAEERIEANRKKNFSLVLKNAQKQAISGMDVQVKLLRHAFPFGTALNFTGNSDDTWYKETAAKYFWAGVLENDFKWPSYENSEGSLNTAKVDSYLEWSEAQGWKLMRGHALEWGIEKYTYDQHWPRLGSREQYVKALKTRIQRDMKAYKGRFQQYDVWNEVFHEPAIFDKWGWDLLDSAMIWARAADPTAQLYLNEYSVVAGGETERFYTIVQDLLERGIPVDGIGVQCHFFDQTIDPASIAMRLDRLAQLGLPIVITEFDLGSMDNGMTLTHAQQAAEVARFVRTAYSHPAVAGILFWGFWDSRHWLTDGGIFEEDKTPKPAADSVYHLWNETWTTNLPLTTNEQGQVRFRGFPGTYAITYGSKTDTLELDAVTNWELIDGQPPLSLYQMPRTNIPPNSIRYYNLQGRLQSQKH